MRRLLTAILFPLLFVATALAQVIPPHNTVSATITDPAAHAFAYAQYVIQLTDANGVPFNGATYQGQPFSPTRIPGSMDATGSFSVSLIPNSAIDQPGTRWKITVSAPFDTSILTLPQTWGITYIANVTADASLTTQLSALAQTVTYLNLKTGQSTIAGALVSVFNPTTAGLVPASGGGTTNFLRADGSFAAPPSSGGGLPAGVTSDGANGLNVAGNVAVGNAILRAAGSDVFLNDTIPTNPGIGDVVIGNGAAPSMSQTPSVGSVGGQYNIIIGHNAGHALTTARESVIIGDQAGLSLTGNGTGSDDNIVTLIGSLAGGNLLQASASIMVGQKAGVSATSSGGDVIMGVHACTLCTTTLGNVILGANTIDFGAGATLESNVVIGNSAMRSVTGDIQGNVAIGKSASQSLQGGAVGNIAIGSGTGNAVGAGAYVTTGNYNIAIGFPSGAGTTPMTGSGNIDLGPAINSTISSGSYNTRINSPDNLTTGSDNFIWGRYTGGITAGSYNIIMGYGAGNVGADHSGSVCIGYSTCAAQSAANGVSIGYSAGRLETSGAANTALGTNALKAVTTGASNTAMGDSALSLLAGAEASDIGVGAGAQVAAGVSNAVQIGAGTNATTGTMQYLTNTVIDSSGNLHGRAITLTTNGTAIAAGTCQQQPVITGNNTLPTSAVAVSLPSPLPATWQTGINVLPPVVTGNNLYIYLCNPTAASITPVAQAINLRLIQ